MSRSMAALISDAAHDQATGVSEFDAHASWVVVSALWHPALLAECDALPRVEPLESAPFFDVETIAVAPKHWLEGGKLATSNARVLAIDSTLGRERVIQSILEHVPVQREATLDLGDAIAADFQALGTCWWLLAGLSRAMGHADVLDETSLGREVLEGARAWRQHDMTAAQSRLRAAFELLTQARERFYPVDNYVLDLMLLDTSTSDSSGLQFALDSRVPLTLIATGRAVDALGRQSPDTLVKLLEAINESKADVIGGPLDEVEEPLLPVESILWQYSRGSRAYETHLDGRSVETCAHRRFGMYPMLPQVARRFGIRYGYHIGFDTGRFPIPRETKRLWESPDGSSIEVLTRPPLSGVEESACLSFAARLARTLKEDHVATLPIVRGSGNVAGWFADMRRSAAYSPVFGRWVTIGEYFHVTDRPWEPFRPTLDEYVMPYLSQAIDRRDDNPISWRARHARLRARLDAACAIQAVCDALSGDETPAQPLDAASELPARFETTTATAHSSNEAPVDYAADLLENRQLDEAEHQISQLERTGSRHLASRIQGTAASEQPGYLILNPLGWSRRCAVLLPDAPPDLWAAGHLKATQFTEDGVWGVFELPAHGFVWLARETPAPSMETPRSVSASGHRLSNGLVEVEIDSTTGGIRSVRRPGEPTARLAQQLALLDPSGAEGGRTISKMVASRVEVEYGGPALAQAVSVGQLWDANRPGQAIASFHQRIRLWWGRPTVELRIELHDVDPQWLAGISSLGVDPWTHGLACRWAWADTGASLGRSSLLALDETKSDRPETPDIFEISTRHHRTALLFGGLAHHKRHETRMLDTLLISGSETSRTFDLGVALDLEHPAQAALDLLTGPILIQTNTGPPPSGPAGWFLQGNQPSVAILRVEFLPMMNHGKEWGLAVHLLETSGRSSRGRLRLFRDPVLARLVDFQGEPIVDLSLDGDAVLIDMTARELACVEIVLGRRQVESTN